MPGPGGSWMPELRLRREVAHELARRQQPVGVERVLLAVAA